MLSWSEGQSEHTPSWLKGILVILKGHGFRIVCLGAGLTLALIMLLPVSKQGALPLVSPGAAFESPGETGVGMLGVPPHSAVMPTGIPEQSALGMDMPVMLNATYEMLLEREVVWQIPTEQTRKGIKGVAFYAHGCHHKATHFWPPSPSCSSCTGLPEEIQLVHKALSRGYAVVAVSSLEVCWQSTLPATSSKDILDVSAVLTTWTTGHGLNAVPLVAFGASSGGYFISCLAHSTQFTALVIMISSGVERAFQSEQAMGKPYPPTLFVHMPKDKQTARGVQSSMALLQSNGVLTAQLKCNPKRLESEFLSSRVIGVSKELSLQVVSALKVEGLVDANGYLVATYRDSWRDALETKKVELEPALAPKVGEELHLAFGWHEMTSEFAAEIMDWFEGVCSEYDADGKVLSSTLERCKAYADRS